MSKNDQQRELLWCNELSLDELQTLAVIQCLRCHVRKEIRAKNKETAREKALVFWNGRAVHV